MVMAIIITMAMSIRVRQRLKFPCTGVGKSAGGWILAMDDEGWDEKCLNKKWHCDY